MEFYYDEVQEDVLIVKADGGLNSRTADQFVESLEKMVDGGLRKIVVDCSKLEHISSYGLGVLIRLHKRLDEKAGDVKFASVKGLIVEVLRLTRLNKLFAMYPDVQTARMAFKEDKKPPIIFR